MPIPTPPSPPDEGLLSSFLNELSLPGYFAKNLLRGDVKAAGKNAADFGLNIVDAAIPFADLIPEISSQKDKPEFTDLVGKPDGFAGEALNFAGNVLTDPISYIPGAAIVKGATTAGKATKAITPQIVQKGIGSAYKAAEPTLAKAGKTLRKTFGAEKIGAGLKNVLTDVEGARSATAGAGQGAAAQALEGATSAELDALLPALHKLTKDANGELIDPQGVMSIEDHITRLIPNHPELDPEKLLNIGKAVKELGQGQFASGAAQDIGGNIFTNVAHNPKSDVVMGAMPNTTGATGINDYIPHVFRNEDPNAIVDELLGSPNATKTRKLSTPKELDDFLKANPNQKLESLPRALQNRTGQQSELAARAAAGKGLFDMARNSGANFSDEFLEKALGEIPVGPKAVVGPSNEAVDILNALGGEKYAPGFDPANPYGIGRQSGKSNPPRSASMGAPTAKESATNAPIAPLGAGTHTLYHGTSNAGFKQFDTYGGEYGLFGDGTYFTDSTKIANEYMKKGRGNSPGVYRANVTVKNPLTMESAANKQAWLDTISKDSALNGASSALDAADPAAMASWAKDIDKAATNEDAFRLVEEALHGMPKSEAREIVSSLIREMGHDSISHIGGGRHAASKGVKHRVIIAMDPEQISNAAIDPNLVETGLFNDIYGIGLTSGKSLPPVTPHIEPSKPDPYGIGSGSGKSSPPKTNLGVVKTGLTDEQRTKARAYILSKDYAHADTFMRQAAEDIAKGLSGDEADVALHALKGMSARGGATKVLNGLNKYFKPYAVYGAVVPKLGSITRNITGGLWQTLSNAESRGELGTALRRAIPSWAKSIEDGTEKLFGVRFTNNEFKQLDEAYRLSGGDPRKVLSAIKDPTMRDAVKTGVFGNNFVDMENLMSTAANGGWRAFGKTLMEYPAAMFKGAEQRMRYGLFKDLTSKGKSAKDAARIVNDTFFDYRISSEENRLARDIIPFFQFPAKAIPQQAKLLMENPAMPGTPLRPLVSGMSNLYGAGRGEPVEPQMEGGVNIPIGTDEVGNQQYLSNLGLPFESLSLLPNLSSSPLQAGRQIEKNIVGSIHPLLKTAYSYTAGHDPYFNTAPGSYQKVAGQDLGAVGGVANQLLSTGAPFTSAAQGLFGAAGNVTDEKTSAAEKLFNYATGAKIKSVDPDRAIQNRIQSYLERNPDIGQYQVLFNKGGDETAQTLLDNLKSAKKAIKEKQAALMPVN